MKAVRISRYGGTDVLEIIEDAAVPKAGKNQVLVEVHAAGINPVDWKIRSGYLKEYVPLTFPVTLGGDFSGIIKEASEGVSGIKAGDEVYGQASILNNGSGSFAEFAAADAGKLAQKPKSATHMQAAALPLVGASALQALQDHVKLQQGQKILIHGGAGGIGHIAVQIAKSLGAFVATTVSSKDRQFARSLGADVVIDYQNENFEELVKNYDAVFDTAGKTVDSSFKVLKKGGIIVSMLGEPDQKRAKEHGVTAIGQNTNSNTEHFKKLAELVDGGKLKVHIDKIFPVEQAKEAFAYQEEGHPKGKVMLKVK